uniref:P3 n=1 Tax=Suaeda salsa virus 1 TaxID=2793741 RepID=A0A8D9PH27_9RHAB|nr:TPA_asm: P3 [Suaeda salsa virus 1]
MVGLYSYKVTSELITGEETNVVSLTKKLNLFQQVSFINAKNVRIKNLTVKYSPRTGTLGTGKVLALVRDNRIDGDISNQIINEFEFRAEDEMTANWSSCIWLLKSEFMSNRDPPLTFEMEVTECNMTSGRSLGLVVVIVEISASNSMDRFQYKSPYAKISTNPAIRGIGNSGSKSFRVTDQTKPMIELKSKSEREGGSDVTTDKRVLAGVARRSLKYR